MPPCVCVCLMQEPEHLAVKTIANTALTVRPNGAHHCMYAAGHTAVNTAFEAVEGPKSRVALHDRLVLHHYVTKSVEDYEAKMFRGSGMGRKKDWVSEASRRGCCRCRCCAAAAGPPPYCRACLISAQEPAALTLNRSTTAPPLLQLYFHHVQKRWAWRCTIFTERDGRRHRLPRCAHRGPTPTRSPCLLHSSCLRLPHSSSSSAPRRSVETCTALADTWQQMQQQQQRTHRVDIDVA